jgi:hypothetical protein
MDKAAIGALASKLVEQNKELYAITICIIREFGLRKREASLFDAKTAYAQALADGKIRIQKGTKGGYGRNMQRYIPVTQYQLALLREAATLQGAQKSLVPKDMTLVQFMRSLDRCWQKIRNQYGLAKIHDLRACYACERYYQLTGMLAPVLNGENVACSRESDRFARKIISHQLGHLRIDIIGAYIGGRR